jgi:hypothetical protein
MPNCVQFIKRDLFISIIYFLGTVATHRGGGVETSFLLETH